MLGSKNRNYIPDMAGQNQLKYMYDHNLNYVHNFYFKNRIRGQWLIIRMINANILIYLSYSINILNKFGL